MSEDDPYPLTRGPQQLVRVHLLQHLWRDTNGYLLHPTTYTSSKQPLRIADVATASGLWLCELANSMSHDSVELHGFDISSESFITNDQLAPNVTLHVGDARATPPQAFVGYFDIVHVRLLQAVILDDDPEWVIQYCMQLLCPGGRLQWEEFDPLGVIVHPINSSKTALESLVQQLHSRVSSNWIKALPKYMTEFNMEIMAAERRHEPAFYHSIVTYLHCLVFEEYAHHLKGSAGQRLLSLVQDAYRECQHGSHVQYLFQTVVAKKPDGVIG